MQEEEISQSLPNNNPFVALLNVGEMQAEILSRIKNEEGMVLQLADGSICACDANAQSILGCTYNQIQGSTSTSFPWQTIHEDGSPFIGEIHPANVALRTGKPCLNVVMGFYKPSGELIWLLVNSRPLFKGNQTKPYGVISHFCDISEQKLQHDKSSFFASCSSVAIPQKVQRKILIVDDCLEDREVYRRYLLQDAECDYTIIDAGSGTQGLELLNLYQPDVVLLDYRLPDINGLEFLGQLELIKNDVYTPIIVLTGQGSEQLAVKLIKAGASDYLVKGAITSEDLLLTIDNAMEKVQLYAQLITERQRTKHILQASHQSLINTLESITDGFFTLDREWRFTYINSQAAKVLCKNREQLLGKNVWDEFPEAVSIAFYREYHRAIVENITVQFEEFFPPLNLWFDVRAYPTQEGLAVYFQDITARKQTEAQINRLLERELLARSEAERTNRIKDEFLAVLSHELRTPLNSIIGWSKILQSRHLDANRINQAVSIIERNAKHQSELIEDLLDVSRILRGKITLNVSAVNLDSIVLDVVETAQLPAQTKNITIATQCLASKSLVRGDAIRLQQIVWNLVSNAVKFTSLGGNVDIFLNNCKQKSGFIQLQVRDTGKGINPDFLPYMFDYFRQEDSSTTRKFGGLGLGLAIVRHLVELHGGTITAESQGEGMGATFTVTLPLLDNNCDIVKTNQEEDLLFNSRTSLDQINILLVEDDQDSRNYTAFLLEQHKANVTAVASAKEALQALIQSQPDIIISDIGMPQMDGYGLLRQIRNHPIKPIRFIPAIALTAYVGDFDKQQAIEAGFQMHLSKPIEPTQLIAMIVKLCQG